MTATLELDCDGKAVVVQSENVIVGRTSKCTVRVVHPLVSREHCRMEPRADGLHVIDLGSVNGTWLNDVRIEGRALARAGDRVGLGRDGAVLVVKRAIVGGVDVTRLAREEDVQTLHAGDARAAGIQARIEVAAHAAPLVEPTTRAVEARPGTAIPIVSAMQTSEIERTQDADRTSDTLPPLPNASRGFAPGLAAGFVAGLLLVGALAKFTHVLDPIRPSARAAHTR